MRIVKILTAVVSVLTITNVIVAVIVVDSLVTHQQTMLSQQVTLLGFEETIRQQVNSILPKLDQREKQFALQFAKIKLLVDKELSFTLDELRRNRLAIGEIKSSLHIRDVHSLTVTAYSPTEDQTDDTPFTTAAMLPVKPGMVAVSRDLFKEGWTFGKKIYIEGLGIHIIGDLMNERWSKRIDIVFMEESQAHRFGKKNLTVALLSI